MGFQDLFVAALFALVFACVIAKFVSVAFYDSRVKADVNKVVKVVEKVNLGNALKVRESRSKKKVKFVDDVVVRYVDQLGFEEGGNEVGEEIKWVVFSGVDGRNGKDEIFKCFDDQKVNDVGKNLIFSDELDKGMPDEAFAREGLGSVEDKNGKDGIFKCFDEEKVNEVGRNLILDEAFEREISGTWNDIDIFDQSWSLEVEENVIVEGKYGKDKFFKCFDEQKVNEGGKKLIFRDELCKGMLDEAFERGISGKRNDIPIFDQNLRLEEEENMIIEGNSEKVETLKCADEVRVKEDGEMIYLLEEVFGSGYSAQEGLDEARGVKEEKFGIEGIDDMIIEEKVIKEETSTSGRSVLQCLIVDEDINDEVFSLQSYGEFVTEHAALDQNEDIQVERLNENVEEGLSKEEEKREMKNEKVIIDEDDDDWEGIERTELEKVFAEAVNYVEIGLQGKDDQLAKLGNDVQMQLYGLHKIAVEGPCHQAQPMALNFFSRAKWNAWQKLGSISPEVAMEEYIKLLTEHFPEWVQHFCDGDGGQSLLESGISHDADRRSSLQDTKPNLLPEPTKIEDN